MQRSIAWRVLLGCLSVAVFHYLRGCQLQKCPPSCLSLGKTVCQCQAVESSTVLFLSGQPYGTCRGAEHLFVCNSPPLASTFVIDIVAVTVDTLSHWSLSVDGCLNPQSLPLALSHWRRAEGRGRTYFESNSMLILNHCSRAAVQKSSSVQPNALSLKNYTLSYMIKLKNFFHNY